MSLQTEERRPVGNPDGVTKEDLPRNFHSHSIPDPDVLWRARARDAVLELAAEGGLFTVADVRARAGQPENAYRWGGLVTACRLAGIITPLDWVTVPRVAKPRLTTRVRRWQGVAR